jgi:hypothetical protein
LQRRLPGSSVTSANSSRAGTTNGSKPSSLLSGGRNPTTPWRYTWGCETRWRFCHAKRSKHYVSQKYGEFFAHVEGLAADCHVLALEETKAYMDGLPQPANASFLKLLRESSTFTQEPAQRQPASNQIRLSNVSAATKTTGDQKQTPNVTPAEVKFSGKRGADGNLERQNKKNKRGGPNKKQDYYIELYNFVF